MTFRDSGGSPWTGRLVSAGVVVLVAALAAATFILSYDGVRDLAVAAGVSWRLARLYPAILDGVLVVACAAACMLRDSSLWRRIYAWFAVAVLVGVVGAADAIHAMDIALPKRPAAGTVAALPWALVMLGFSLWLTMLRHARPARGAAPDPLARALGPAPVVSAPASAPASAPVVSAPASESGPDTPSRTVVLEPLVPGFEDAPAEVPEMTPLPEPDAAPEAAEAAASAEAAEAAAPTEEASVADAAPEPESTTAGEAAVAHNAGAETIDSPEGSEGSQANETADAPEVGAPRLYRVRSTPVPPAD